MFHQGQWRIEISRKGVLSFAPTVKSFVLFIDIII